MRYGGRNIAPFLDLGVIASRGAKSMAPELWALPWTHFMAVPWDEGNNARNLVGGLSFTHLGSDIGRVISRFGRTIEWRSGEFSRAFRADDLAGLFDATSGLTMVYALDWHDPQSNVDDNELWNADAWPNWASDITTAGAVRVAYDTGNAGAGVASANTVEEGKLNVVIVQIANNLARINLNGVVTQSTALGTWDSASRFGNGGPVFGQEENGGFRTRNIYRPLLTGLIPRRLSATEESALVDGWSVDAFAMLRPRPLLIPVSGGGGGTTGTISQTLSAVTQSATGTVTNPVSGTVAQTLSPLTQSASGAITFSGTAAQTLQAVTQSASGNVGDVRTGTISQSLTPATQSASGALSFTGTASQTLQAVTQAATGAETFSGTAAQTLQAAIQSASGTSGSNRTGTITQTLSALTQSATGALEFTGTISQTLQPVTQSASESFTFTATITQTLPAITQAMVGVSVDQVLRDALRAVYDQQDTRIVQDMPDTRLVADLADSRIVIDVPDRREIN